MQPERPNPPLVVYSHLRWDFVFQLPQHLLSRMASNRQVIFIEEPIKLEASAPGWELTYPSANVTVARPCLAVDGFGFSDAQLPLLSLMVTELLNELGITEYVAWLYTPMALPLAQSICPEPLSVIYDCMDALAEFRFAPPELVDREAALMGWADLVITGGHSLYKAKEGKHDNLYCFPSSVNAAHFTDTKLIEEESDQKALPHPRLGWFGVIDERIDLDIRAALAKAHPEWSIFMVGPVVTIDPATLPEAPNIQCMGSRSYSEFPSYIAGWDACIQPFAMNEATRFISPTKTLEFMASDLPIVSTPITDVVDEYSHIVYLGGTADEFVSACEAALEKNPEQSRIRIQDGRRTLAQTSWDRTAADIEDLILKLTPEHSFSIA